tara:strand:- start:546 stop:1124 length:579 start_codon:yes stop_codon:yes gene_type:complete
VDYARGLEIQNEARDRVLGGAPDELLLLEHTPIVTLGRRGGEVDNEALQAMNTSVLQTNRGGLATWHGPGQLVGYPIVNLHRRGINVLEMVNRLGDTMRSLCQDAGIKEATYECSRPGVYIEGRKLGAIGMHIHRGVTTHGFALNVDCDLRGFRSIVACGQVGMETTSLAQELGQPVSMAHVLDQIEHLLNL